MMIREWLPITIRNRMALGFAFAALVMFVVWNLMPYYPMVDEPSEGLVLTGFWPRFFDIDLYLIGFRSPNVRFFMDITAITALFLNALFVLTVIPFWKILHASRYLTIPVAVVNFIGGTVIFWFVYDIGVNDAPKPKYSLLVMSLIACTMYFLGLAMLVFKNELVLRHEREVVETLDSKL